MNPIRQFPRPFFLAMALLIALLALTPNAALARSARPAAFPVASTAGLAGALNSDGTLRADLHGSFATQGYTIQIGADGTPTFKPPATPAIGDGARAKSPIDPPTNTSGSYRWDSNFGLRGTNGFVRALAVSGSSVYIGGYFSVAGTVEASNIVRWDGGSSWAALGSGVNDTVIALTLIGSDLYVGGDFTYAGGVSANHIAKWNGSSWAALGSGVNDTVHALAANGNTLYVGGDFTNASGLPAGRVARWEGGSWTALGSGMDNTVNTLLLAGGILYAGGEFANADSLPAAHLALWTGVAWRALVGGGTDGPVYALAQIGSNLYVGGAFTQTGGHTTPNLAVYTLASGWTPYSYYVSSTVYALAVNGTDLYFGGNFTYIQLQTRNRIARLDTVANTISALGNGMNDDVRTIALSGGMMLVGGVFTSAATVVTPHLAQWTGSTWLALTTSQGVQSAGEVRVVTIQGSDVYIGGQFSQVGGVAANNIARWDGSAWHALGSGTDDTVNALVVSSGNGLYVGGNFTRAGGVAANHIAFWGSGIWLALGSGTNGTDGPVYSLANHYGYIYVGGRFTTAGGLAANNIAVYSGGWSALGSGTNNVVFAVAVDASGTVYAGGSFNQAGGHTARAIARYSRGVWHELGGGVSGGSWPIPIVYTLLISGANVYVGGRFGVAGDVASPNLAVWNDNYPGWGTVGGGVRGSDMYEGVFALALTHDQLLYVGGDIDRAGGAIVRNLAFWTGSTWSDVGGGTGGLNSNVLGLALTTDGLDTLFAGGQFDTAGVKASICIARWYFNPILP